MFKKWFKPNPSREMILPNGKKAVLLQQDISKVKQWIDDTFGQSLDLWVEDVEFGGKKGVLIYLITMADGEVVAEKILEPLTAAAVHHEKIDATQSLDEFCKNYLSGAQKKFIEYEHEAIDQILNGFAILFLQDSPKALSIHVKKYEKRGVEEPTTQTIVRGSKEGFIEDLQSNITLIRRKVKNPALRFEEFILGTETSTRLCLVYVDGIVNKQLLDEARHRLEKINTNALFDTGMLEEFLVDKTITPFPLLYNSERPDVISAHILSGKFAIILDGTPFVLSAPVVFSDFITISEDYYQTFLMGSFIRILRYFSFLIALLLPAFYVAIITYHHEMIPTQLLISIIAQREGIPFPAVVEALLMEITFEILREAGIRMPRAVGGTISIVGGLVIGQAAVEAGIVSNIMVIVVALTAISSFVVPVYTFAIATRLLRFLFIILASIFGLFGVFIGMICMVAHLVSLRSFSVPYLAPIAPFSLQDQEDIFIRLPSWAMRKRPSYLKSEKPYKQKDAKSPSPPVKSQGGVKRE